jgi:methylenetetrahydrofolate dehydrogenase (NADP+)/methenyltetrahydrofolate cyclohydrolase
MMGRLLSDEPAYYPATAEAILNLLKHYNCPLEGKNAVIIGRSISVGKPVSLLLLKNNATVTICHSRTENIKKITNIADIIVVAVGIKHFLKEDMVLKNTWIVDVGYNYDSEGGPYGDCDFNALKDKVHAITPVPGGVGPVTTATLLYNAVKAIKKM